jgi:hypothetical protein
MLHRHLVLLALVGTYFSVATLGLAWFDAGLLVTAITLFGVPALALAHFTLAPAAVVLAVTFLGAGLAVILEGVAHVYGLWYSLGSTELRLFGILPVEMIVAVTLQVLFFGLLYEVLFDDGSYTEVSAQKRFGYFVVFTAAAVGLMVLQVFLRSEALLTYSYLWLIGSLVAASFTIVFLHRQFSIAFIDRVFDFMLIAAVPSALALWIAAHNVHKVFGNPHEYLATFSLFGEVVPVEEVALLFALPCLVAVCYELYLDDRT